MRQRQAEARRAAAHSVRAFGLLVVTHELRRAAQTLGANTEDDDLAAKVRAVAKRVDRRRRRIQEREP